MKRLASNIAAGFGAEATLDFRVIFAPLVNDVKHARAFADAAADLVGEANVDRNKPPANASEDFSFMMEKVPGAYINLGNGEDSAPLHNPPTISTTRRSPTASRCSPASWSASWRSDGFLSLRGGFLSLREGFLCETARRVSVIARIARSGATKQSPTGSARLFRAPPLGLLPRA